MTSSVGISTTSEPCNRNASVSTYQAVGTNGDLRVDPAYAWQGELKHYLTVNGETQERTFGPHDQFAAVLVYFSDCLLQNKDPEP